MLETAFFIFGLGFSLIVYVQTIHYAELSSGRKMLYTILSAVGITGTVWLFGILVAHFLRKTGFLS